MTHSTTRQYRPLAVPDVTIGGFWGSWQDAICDHTAAILLDRCVEARMLEQIDIRVPSPGMVIPAIHWLGSSQMFWDSDLAKSIETIAYSLYRKPNPELERRADEIIDMYEALQEEDGYLNSFFQRIWPEKKWTNLRDFHELYCAGHMMEAAVAYHQATGKRKFLDVMSRMADYCVKKFGRGPGQVRGYCGHEEVELALVRLSRETGKQAYMDLAKFFVDERGQEPNFFVLEAEEQSRSTKSSQKNTFEYNQSHKPVRDQDKVVGHAVRAMYLYSAMADIATEYNDDSLTEALEVLWKDLTHKQMYLTGGIGPQASNEGFTDHYDLPNESAYAETCASVGLVFWASRMLGRGPDRRFADTMEIALYNGAIAGLSRDGQTFFYENPLESAGKHHRWEWHVCPCCPPNIARLVASLGSYVYQVADDAIAVHLYCESEARVSLKNGAKVTLRQETDYPWSGDIAFSVETEGKARFSLDLRVPEWVRAPSLSINGETIALDGVLANGYASIDREWSAGDRVELGLPLEPRAVRANPKVRQDAGRVAVMRGPLVYCLEEADNGAGLNSILLERGLGKAETATIREIDAIAIDLPVLRELADGWGDALYAEKQPETKTETARLVPYHLWDNRDPGEMLVWVREGQA